MRPNLRTEQIIMKNWKGTKPVVSICCLAYNHEPYIEDALEGFLIQETDFPFEVLIHDDASTDRTAAIIREYEAAYPHIIKPIYQSENQHSKNVRISTTYQYPRAQGEYIALCEGDDYWLDNKKLQIQFEILNGDKHISCCCHSYIIVNKNKEKISEFKRPTGIINIDDIIMNNKIPQTATRMFRKKDLNSMPQFFYDCTVGDYPNMLNATTKGNIYCMDNVFSAYRIHPENSWVSNMYADDYLFKKHIKSLTALVKNYDEYTNHKYNNIINSRLAYLDFLKYKRQKQIIQVMKNSYYCNMTIKNKVLTIVSIICPNVLKKIFFKHYFSGRNN